MTIPSLLVEPCEPSSFSFDHEGLALDATAAAAAAAAAAPRNETTPSSLSTAAPPKYSRKYLEDRIHQLQQIQLRGHQDLWNNVVDPHGVFQSLLVSCEAAYQTVIAVQKSLTALQDEIKKEPNNDALPPLVEAAQHAVDQAQQALDHVRDSIAQQAAASTTTMMATSSSSTSTSTSSSVLHGWLVQRERALLECTVLVQATPAKLAEWCCPNANTSDDNDEICRRRTALLDDFLDDDIDLMRDFVRNGGPCLGRYGEAIEIYAKIRATESRVEGKDDDSDEDGDHDDTGDMRHKLALAVALEHANPIGIYKSEGRDGIPTRWVDPVERYYHYLHAHRAGGQLDAAFASLTVWELRLVVDSNATHEDLEWGRTYLQAYRPDQITWMDDQWRYVEAVRTDIGYRHPDHEFFNYRDLLSAGGVCGARAWFGRFICKCFGMPTWGVRQPGHAALSRLAPSKGGWVICMGAAWKFSTWDDHRYVGNNDAEAGTGMAVRSGPDFYQETRARKNAAAASSSCSCSVDRYYKNVVLLECLAECLGETVEENFVVTKPWRSLSLALRRKLAMEETWRSAPLELGNCNAYVPIKRSNIFNGTVKPDGTIVIPAASFVQPTKPSSKVLVMDSFPSDGSAGAQLHLEQDGTVEYDLPSSLFPAGSTFDLCCRIVNVHRVDSNSPLLVCVTGLPSLIENTIDEGGFVLVGRLDQAQELPVHYTKGSWDWTAKIQISIGQGDCRLKLSRKTPCWGLSIKDIWLCPTKSQD